MPDLTAGDDLPLPAAFVFHMHAEKVRPDAKPVEVVQAVALTPAELAAARAGCVPSADGPKVVRRLVRAGGD